MRKYLLILLMLGVSFVMVSPASADRDTVIESVVITNTALRVIDFFSPSVHHTKHLAPPPKRVVHHWPPPMKPAVVHVWAPPKRVMHHWPPPKPVLVVHVYHHHGRI